MTLITPEMLDSTGAMLVHAQLESHYSLLKEALEDENCDKFYFQIYDEKVIYIGTLIHAIYSYVLHKEIVKNFNPEKIDSYIQRINFDFDELDLFLQSLWKKEGMK